MVLKLFFFFFFNLNISFEDSLLYKPKASQWTFHSRVIETKKNKNPNKNQTNFEGMFSTDFCTSTAILSSNYNQNISYLHLNFCEIVSNCRHHVASSHVSHTCFFVILISSSLSLSNGITINQSCFLYYLVYSAMGIWENKIRANSCME